MKVNGIAIGRGVYDILPKNDKAAVAFGMAPKWMMDLLEKQIRDRMAAIYCAKYEIEPDDELIDKIGKTVKQEPINQALKEIHIGLLQAAKERGKLLV